MKTILFIFILLLGFSKIGNSFSKGDSTQNKFFIEIINWELGPVYSVKENNRAIFPHGINQYLNNKKTGYFINISIASLYYNKKWGVDFLFTSYGIENINNSDFKNYLESKYNDYSIKLTNDYFEYYNLASFGLRLCYRFSFKHFNVTPKFQVSFPRSDSYENTNTFKKKGSNSLLEYSFLKEYDKRKRISFTTDISKVFSSFKIGLNFQYTIAPEEVKYTITEKSFGGMSTINSLTVKQLNQFIGIGVTFGFSLEEIMTEDSSKHLYPFGNDGW